MWTRKELKQKAKEALKRNYWKVVLVSFVMICFGGGVSPAAASSSNASGTTAGTTSAAIVDSVGEDGNDREDVFDNAIQPDSVMESVVSELEQTDSVVLAITAAVMIMILFIIMAIILAVVTFIGNPLIIGSQRFMIKCLDGKGNISELGYTFDHAYLNGVKTMFLRELYVFLWAILFIIPGIYKKYQYYMVEYILAENPELPSKEVLELSKKMMQGHKWNAFVLDISFIFWHMLGMITCGITELLYVQPYIFLTRASLYCTLCHNNENERIELGDGDRDGI